MTDRIPAALRLIPQVRRVVRQSDEARRDAERRAEAAEEARRVAVERIEAAEAAENHLIMLPRGPDAKYAVPMNHAPSRDLRPRWGYTQPLIPILRDWFASYATSYRMFLDEMARSARLLADIPRDFKPERFPEPGWHGLPFTPFDLLALYTMVRLQKPETYIMVGTSMSACFAARAIRDHGLNTRLVSIAPESNGAIDAICDDVLGVGLETCDLTIFDTLRAGDIVFVNGSHRSFTNSDVTVFMIDVLPRLRPGVIVQIHDVVLPWDYDNMFLNWYWNEQYILAAYMMAGRDRLDPLLPTAFICQDSGFSRRLRRPFIDFGDDALNSGWQYGGSMWFTHLAVAAEQNARPAVPDREPVSDQTPKHRTPWQAPVVVRRSTVSEHIESLLSRDWEEDTPAAHEALCADVLAVLDHQDVTSLPREQFVAVVGHINELYMASSSRTALRVAPSLECAVQHYLKRPETTMEDACGYYDALYFLYWINSMSIDEMRGFGPGVVEPFAAYARRSAPRLRPAYLRVPKPPFRLVYLSRFVYAGQGNAIYPVTRALLCSLAEHQTTRYRPMLYAWEHHVEDALRPIEAQGIPVRRFPEMRVADRIGAIKQALIEDGVDVLISDMNSSVPAVLFEHRVAPIQIYYQLGMPAWPLREIDHVLRVWEFDPLRAGFDPAICSTLNGAWDMAEFAPPPNLALIAAERERMPKTRHLFGTYTRLSKITLAFLAIVAELLNRHTDLGIVLGGTGDASHIRDFATRHGFPADRFRLVEGYADGQTWGWLLDAFLDTFPQQGGGSCCEMIAKGRPVVSALSPDMRNLARQRVTLLTAASEQEYLGIASRLAADDEFLAAAQAATRALAERMPGRAEYAASLDQAITATIEQRRQRGTVWRLLRSFAPSPGY